MLILVTGRSGTGKSAVHAELLARGFKSYGTDEGGISAWFANDSGLMADSPHRSTWATPEWYTTHTYALRRDRLEEIAHAYSDVPVFICGTAAGELDMGDLFARVICLVVNDADVIRERIEGRMDNPFGKEPHEMQAILAAQGEGDPCHGHQASRIDATRPLDEVVDQVIALATEEHSRG